MRGEPSARSVAMVLCLRLCRSSRARSANSGAAVSKSRHVAMGRACHCAPTKNGSSYRALMSLLVVAALEEEIEALRRRHPAQPVLVTGPGKALAAGALATQLATDRPDAVLVLGTAGALAPGLAGVHEVS